MLLITRKRNPGSASEPGLKCSCFVQKSVHNNNETFFLLPFAMYEDNENCGWQLASSHVLKKLPKIMLCLLSLRMAWRAPWNSKFLETVEVIHHFINIFKYSLMYSNFSAWNKKVRYTFDDSLCTATPLPLTNLFEGRGRLFNADRLLDCYDYK